MICVVALRERDGVPLSCHRGTIELLSRDKAPTLQSSWNVQRPSTRSRPAVVSFAEAATALRDPFAATASDPDHSAAEHRFLTFGVSAEGRLLVVAHTDQGDVLRIISARMASRLERKIYEEG